MTEIEVGDRVTFYDGELLLITGQKQRNIARDEHKRGLIVKIERPSYKFIAYSFEKENK
jgi:hypothetical protein